MEKKVRKVKISVSIDEDIYKKLVTISYESKLRGDARRISVSELINEALREKYGGSWALFKNKKLKELEDRLSKVSEEATAARLKAEVIHDSIKDIYTSIFMIKERMNIIDSRMIDLEYDVKGLKRDLSELGEKLEKLENRINELDASIKTNERKF